MPSTTSLGRLPIATFPRSSCPGSPSGGRMSEVPLGHGRERCGEKKKIVNHSRCWLLVAQLLPWVTIRNDYVQTLIRGQHAYRSQTPQVVGLKAWQIDSSVILHLYTSYRLSKWSLGSSNKWEKSLQVSIIKQQAFPSLILSFFLLFSVLDIHSRLHIQWQTHTNSPTCIIYNYSIDLDLYVAVCKGILTPQILFLSGWRGQTRWTLKESEVVSGPRLVERKLQAGARPCRGKLGSFKNYSTSPAHQEAPSRGDSVVLPGVPEDHVGETAHKLHICFNSGDKALSSRTVQ